VKTRVIGKSTHISAQVIVHGNKDKWAGSYGIQRQFSLLLFEGE